MTGLDNWLEQATRGLSKESAAQVRGEIREHYESAREAAISDGAAEEEAERLALAALGDAKTANRQYKRVLLTASEARMLREANWEVHAICSRPWLKWALMILPSVLPLVSAGLLLSGEFWWGVRALGATVALFLLFSPLFLPIHTPARSRVYRVVKWIGWAAALPLVLGPGVLKYDSAWVLMAYACYAIETTRASIRRKLPVEKWPKQLYF